MRHAVLIGGLAVASGVAMAAQTTVPNAFASTGGETGLNTFIRDTGAPRAGQLLIGASQLGAISPGMQITGMYFRLYSNTAFNPAGTWPTTPISWNNYEVRVGTAALGVAGSSTVFANNLGGDTVLARSGALTLGANSFSGGANSPTANSWGPLISFTTPFTYSGGDLVIEIRHDGGTFTPTRFLDAVLATNPGYGTDFRSITTTTFAGTTGVDASFTITQLEYVIPGPGGAALFGMAGLIGLRRRR
ncbi:MAG: hypothetical protein AB7G17_06985 [Phycisphaerales bacterium]